MADGSTAIPRHDAQAEQACLSAALFDQAAALELVELLEESDYHFGQNRHVHAAIRAICARGDQVDAVSVHAELHATKRLAGIGGAAYLATLAERPHIARLEQYARVVKGWSRVRRALDTFRQLVAEAQHSEIPDVDAWLDTCETRAYAATADTDTARQTSATYAEIGAILRQGWDEAGERADRTWGVSTGYQRLDEHTLGMRPGQLWFLGARPGQGKTAWAQQLIEYVATRGGGKAGVVFLSMEMTRAELALRAVARESRVGHRQIQRRAQNADWDAVAQATSTLQRIPVAIDDQKKLSPLRARAKVLRLQAELRKAHPEAKLALVVIDYVQLMVPDRERQNGTRAGELGEITRSLKGLAGDFDCTVLALSQLTRPEKGKAPPAPTLFDFRDSGSIEADGDVVIGLHRPDQYKKPGEPRDHLCQVHVLKGRGCGEAAFELVFDGPTTHFANIDPRDDQLWRPEE